MHLISLPTSELLPGVSVNSTPIVLLSATVVEVADEQQPRRRQGCRPFPAVNTKHPRRLLYSTPVYHRCNPLRYGAAQLFLRCLAVAALPPPGWSRGQPDAQAPDKSGILGGRLRRHCRGGGWRTPGFRSLFVLQQGVGGKCTLCDDPSEPTMSAAAAVAVALAQAWARGAALAAAARQQTAASLLVANARAAHRGHQLRS